MTSGIHAIDLVVQHTMHPDIAQFVSDEFYGGSLTNHPCCSDRRQSHNFERLCSDMPPTARTEIPTLSR